LSSPSKGIVIAVGFLVTIIVVMSGFLGYMWGRSNSTLTVTTVQTSLVTTEVPVTQRISTTSTIIQTKTEVKTQTNTETKTTTKTSTITTTETLIGSEKLNITSIFLSRTGSNLYIDIKYKNIGNVITKITDVYVNGHPLLYYSSQGVSTNPTIGSGILVEVGEGGFIQVKFEFSTFVSGQSIEVKLKTYSGAQFGTYAVIP